MKQAELQSYLSSNFYVDTVSLVSTGWNTLFLIYATDSSVLEYLNSNNAPVVYSDIDGLILVKY